MNEVPLDRNQLLASTRNYCIRIYKRVFRRSFEGAAAAELSSFITYKRFKRTKCQLVNIIIMTSNIARGLYTV